MPTMSSSLQARYAADPACVDASWAAFFRALGDSEIDAKRQAAGPELGARRLAAAPDRRADRGADRRVAAIRRKRPRPSATRSRAKAAEKRRRASPTTQIQRAVLDSSAR